MKPKERENAMKKLTVNRSVFEVDIAATAAYYAALSPCSCVFCRNYAAEIASAAPALAEALQQFGVDVRYPDANKCYDLPDRTVCYLPRYTVYGRILQDAQEDLQLGEVRAVACKKIASDPNAPSRFYLDIYSVKHIPWGLDYPFEEAFPPEQKPLYQRLLGRKAKNKRTKVKK